MPRAGPAGPPAALVCRAIDRLASVNVVRMAQRTTRPAALDPFTHFINRGATSAMRTCRPPQALPALGAHNAARQDCDVRFDGWTYHFSVVFLDRVAGNLRVAIVVHNIAAGGHGPRGGRGGSEDPLGDNAVKTTTTNLVNGLRISPVGT